MNALTLPSERELDFGQGLRKISELAGLIVALMGLTGFLVVFFAVLYLLALPISFAFIGFYGWVNKKEQIGIQKKLPSMSQADKLKLCRRINEEVKTLDTQLIKWNEVGKNRTFISNYFYNRIKHIHEVGVATEKMIIAATYPNATELGLSTEQTQIMRNSFQEFKDDWDREDMDEYDEIIAS